VGRWAVRRFDCGFGGEDGGDARLKVESMEGAVESRVSLV